MVERLPAGDERGAEAVYPKALHAAETGLAGRLLRARSRSRRLPLAIDVERALAWFEERERLVARAASSAQAIRRGLTSKVLVITGGPGTGKTTLVRGIVAILEKKGQQDPRSPRPPAAPPSAWPRRPAARPRPSTACSSSNARTRRSTATATARSTPTS